MPTTHECVLNGLINETNMMCQYLLNHWGYDNEEDKALALRNMGTWGGLGSDNN